MKALIDPRSGRVCELRQEEFAVADPLFWLDVGDEVTRRPPDDYRTTRGGECRRRPVRSLRRLIAIIDGESPLGLVELECG